MEGSSVSPRPHITSDCFVTFVSTYLFRMQIHLDKGQIVTDIAVQKLSTLMNVYKVVASMKVV